MAIKPRSTILTDIISRFITGLLKNITAKKHRDQHTDLAESMEHVLEGSRTLAGNTVLFDWSKGYIGDLAGAALVGDIVLNMTGAIPGAWSLVKHKEAQPPAITGLPAGQILQIHDLATSYKADADNYIFIQCIGNDPNTVSVRVLDRSVASGGPDGVQSKIENGNNKVEVTSSLLQAYLDNLQIMLSQKVGDTTQTFLGDVAGGTTWLISSDPGVEASTNIDGYIDSTLFFRAVKASGTIETLLGNPGVGGDTWLKVSENGDEILLHADNIKLDKLLLLPDAAPTSKAVSLDGSGNLQYGPVDGSGGPADTDALNEGSSNLYFTQARVSANADLLAAVAKLLTIETDAKDDQTGPEIEGLLDTTFGNTDWKLPPGAASFLPNFINIAAAPTTGVPVDAFTFIDFKLHKFNGTTWVDQSEDLTITTSYEDIVSSSSGTLTLTRSNVVSYAGTTLTEDATIVLDSMNQGDIFKLKVIAMNGHSLALPTDVTVLRGAFEDTYVNYVEFEKVSLSEYTAKIRSLVAPVAAPSEVLIFRQDVSGGSSYFASRAEALDFNAGSSNPAVEIKFSRLGELDTFQRTGGEWRFKVVWPRIGKEIVFEQTSNFTTAAPNTVTGYNFISSVGMNGPTLIGLVDASTTGGTPGYFKGRTSTGAALYYYSFGSFQDWNAAPDNFPGPQDVDGFDTVDLVEIYAITD